MTNDHAVRDHILIDGQDYFVCQCGWIWDVFAQPQRTGGMVYGPTHCPRGQLEKYQAIARTELVQREVADWQALQRDQQQTLQVVLPVLTASRTMNRNEAR